MAVYEKRPGQYYLDYYLEGKRIREPGGRTKTEANYRLAKRLTEIREGKLNLQALNGRIPFTAFASEYLKMSAGYKRSYKREEIIIKHLNGFFGDKPLGKITAYDVENYRQERLNFVTQSSINREGIVLRHMFNTAVKHGKMMQNPMQHIKQYKIQERKIRVITKEEEEKLLKASCPHLKPIIITALYTGMRLGELLNLKCENVDMNGAVITVVDTKSTKKRTIPINNELKTLLNCVIKVGNDIVFCDDDGSHIKAIKTAFNNAVRRSGIKHCRFHDTRATFASRLVEKGVNIVTVKELLGHADIRTTMRYANPAPEYKKQAVEALCSQ